MIGLGFAACVTLQHSRKAFHVVSKVETARIKTTADQYIASLEEIVRLTDQLADEPSNDQILIELGDQICAFNVDQAYLCDTPSAMHVYYRGSEISPLYKKLVRSILLFCEKNPDPSPTSLKLEELFTEIGSIK